MGKVKELQLLWEARFLLTLTDGRPRGTWEIARIMGERIDPMTQMRSLGFGDIQCVSQDIALLYGWSACNRGLVHAFVNPIDLEVAPDGEVILTSQDVDALWGEVTGCNPPVEWRACVAKGPPSYTLVQYVLSGLVPGTHELHTHRQGIGAPPPGVLWRCTARLCTASLCHYLRAERRGVGDRQHGQACDPVGPEDEQIDIPARDVGHCWLEAAVYCDT